MDFAFTSDQQLLKNSARAFLDEHCKPATVRLLWDDARGESEAMWKEMAQLGWLGLALPEAHGGSDLGMVETALLLEELGRASYPGPYLPTVLVATRDQPRGLRGAEEPLASSGQRGRRARGGRACSMARCRGRRTPS